MDKKYYLKLYDVEFEVSKEDYEAYYKEKRRNKYLIEVDRANELAYYHDLDTDECLGIDIIRDQSSETEDIVENQIMIEKLHNCIKFLNETELTLINELFFKGKTERELSAETEIPQQTINNRKQRILKKLKCFFENN